MTGTGREPVGVTQPTPGRTAARVAAGLSIAIMLFEVAALLGVPWDYVTQVRHSLGLAPRPWPKVTSAVGAVEWALFAMAFLARVGEGPLRAAPRGLVAALAWFATLSSGYGVLTSWGWPSLGWRVGWMVVFALVGAFGLTALIRTRQVPPPNPSSASPPGPPQDVGTGLGVSPD